jgi:hypothetical protein
VRYLATLLGAGDQDVMRWFILVVAVLLDPAPSCCSWRRRAADSGLVLLPAFGERGGIRART